METPSDAEKENILSRIKEMYEKVINYLYLSLLDIKKLLYDIEDNPNNIFDEKKIEDCQNSINKIFLIIKKKYSKQIDDKKNKTLYKSKLINFYFKELFKDENDKEEYYYPFYLLSYIMIIINHHEVCLSE